MSERSSGKFFFTAGELIEILNGFPNDMPVLTSGYESGYDNIYQPSAKKLKHIPENRYYEGEFQIAEEGDQETFEAVILERVTRRD
jgi:hypothetical protein